MISVSNGNNIQIPLEYSSKDSYAVAMAQNQQGYDVLVTRADRQHINVGCGYSSNKVDIIMIGY